MRARSCVASQAFCTRTGAGSRVTAYLGKNVTANAIPPEALGFDAFPGFSGGVFVGYNFPPLFSTICPTGRSPSVIGYTIVRGRFVIGHFKVKMSSPRASDWCQSKNNSVTGEGSFVPVAWARCSSDQ